MALLMAQQQDLLVVCVPLVVIWLVSNDPLKIQRLEAIDLVQCQTALAIRLVAKLLIDPLLADPGVKGRIMTFWYICVAVLELVANELLEPSLPAL